jgi:hypothetical protein
MTTKGAETMPKGLGNRWSPSVDEGKSEFYRAMGRPLACYRDSLPG